MFKKKILDLKELLPFCTRCFHIGAIAEEDANFCHMCGSQGTCTPIERDKAQYLIDNIGYAINHAIDYGKKKALGEISD